jgi:hypothetical protein
MIFPERFTHTAGMAATAMLEQFPKRDNLLMPPPKATSLIYRQFSIEGETKITEQTEMYGNYGKFDDFPGFRLFPFVPFISYSVFDSRFPAAV